MFETSTLSWERSNPSRIGLPGVRLAHPVRGVLQTAAILVIAGFLIDFAEQSTFDRPLDLLIAVCLASHLLLFTVSTAYHCVAWLPVSKSRMQRVDHSAIYVKIAASAGPFAWFGFGPSVATWLISLTWAIALVGVFQKMFFAGVHERISSYVQVAQAILMLPAILEVVARSTAEIAGPLLLGALCYAVGGAVFLLERPRLWPDVYSFHEVFHTFVVTGGISTAIALLALARTSI